MPGRQLYAKITPKGAGVNGYYLHSGSGKNYVALNGSGTNAQSAYAIWAGAKDPERAPFWVKKDGSIKATDGTFKGTLQASKLAGALMATDENAWLVGCGIAVGPESGTTDSNDPSTANKWNFHVDPQGNVRMMGNLTLSSGAIKWDNLDGYVTDTIDGAYAAANEAEKIARAIAAGKYEGGTFINGQMIYSPKIYAGTFYAQKNDDTRKMTMSNDGLRMYIDNIDEPKFLVTTGQSGSRVSLRLGAGNGTTDKDGNPRDVLRIYKDEDEARIVYDTPNGGECGFVFKQNGTIGVLGDLNAYARFA